MTCLHVTQQKRSRPTTIRTLCWDNITLIFQHCEHSSFTFFYTHFYFLIYAIRLLYSNFFRSISSLHFYPSKTTDWLLKAYKSKQLYQRTLFTPVYNESWYRIFNIFTCLDVKLTEHLCSYYLYRDVCP